MPPIRKDFTFFQHYFVFKNFTSNFPFCLGIYRYMQKVNNYPHKTFVWGLMMILHVMACAQSGSDDGVTPPPNMMAPFSSAEIAGDIQTSDIQESSGIVASRAHASALWTHNDSGGEPKIYLISTTGEGMGTYYLEGAQNRDWEDIAIGPGPQPDVNYI
jgi:hypothetical protein